MVSGPNQGAWLNRNMIRPPLAPRVALMISADLGNFIHNVPPTLTYIDEPMAWESVVATLRFETRSLKSISFRAVVLNTLGDGPRRRSRSVRRST